MLLAAMLINASHAALEDRIVVFRRVRVNFILLAVRQLFVRVANVFLVLVLHAVVARELLPYLTVVRRLVRVPRCFAFQVRADDRRNVRDPRSLDVETADLAAALNKAQHDMLVARPRPDRLAFDVEVERFVDSTT